MILLLISFFISLIACGLLIRYQAWHSSLSGDHDFLSPQKFHRAAVPRIGGVGIATGSLFAIFVGLFINPAIAKLLALAGLTALPLFGIGIAEDLTKRISVRIRLIFAFLSALLFLYFFDIRSIRLDIPIIDTLMGYSVPAIFFLAFAITGLANAYNIIDGFNGLASMVAVIAATAILYIAFKVQDPLVMSLAFIIIGSAIGFFIWNYPKGFIFLGDGGAYLIGFLIAVTSILLVVRNFSVSPWFALSINIYPVFETLFSIYRRLVYRNKSIGQADAIHFHTLIYRRVIGNANPHLPKADRNTRTAPYLWLLVVMNAIPSILLFNSTMGLQILVIVFIIVYWYLYRSIVRFQTPAWFRFHRTVAQSQRRPPRGY
jgi:UDP-N-acetylmuramyl pentapeptide phosphotransferase/UDP-N-acetylglucosamine-1-phosphate transferase